MQIFGNESQILFSTGAVQFFPLHVTTQNFPDTARRQNVSNGMTVVAYLLVNSHIAFVC